MANPRILRSMALVVLLAMLAVACGQKEGVHNVGLTGDGGGGGEFGGGEVVAGGDDGTAAVDGTDGFGTDPGAGGTDTSGGTTGGTSGGTTGGTSGGTSGGTTGGTSGGTGGGGPSGPAPGGGDTTGITAETIKIGVHAPLTGAAPLPQSSFVAGKDQYWKHIGKVHGRNVEVVIVDDQYNPSRATSVCNELIQKEKVYLLVGGGGTDQISACARVAAQQGVPYLSAGVDEGQLRKLKNYFALGMSYLQQAPLLIQWIKKNSPPPNNKLAIMRDRTPGFNGVVAKVAELGKAAGYEVLIRQFQNGPSDASWLTQNDIKVAFPIMAPSSFVQIVRSPGGTIDQWAGIGITMGLNTVASTACQGNPAYSGSMFFSPAPGLNVIDQLDPNFRKAGGTDDIHLLLWGLNKDIHAVFQKMQPGNLSRQAFIQAFENNVIDTKVYPVLKHTPQNHFGAQDVHVLIANCQTSQYETPPDGIHRSSF